MLSGNDIIKYIVSGDIKIYPFDKKNLTGIGYNLSTTYFAFSVTQGLLLTVYEKIIQHKVKHYVYIPKNDTVLFFSKEYISVSNKIAGIFESKVSRVCQGLGHISTTLDPTWHGQLIISVNNPTSRDIKFELDEENGNVFTLLFFKYDQPVVGAKLHDNNSGRCDLLLERFAEPGPNPLYLEKHLQLKDFIISEFAASLNGYDDFLLREKDEFTLRIDELIKLKKRMQDDKTLIEENKLNMGKNGRYYILKNSEELDLIKGCTLFSLKKQIFNNGEHSKSDDNLLNSYYVQNTIYKSRSVLKEYIQYINYELEMINHSRRIRWQNKKTFEYAGEESELVLLRKKSKSRERIQKIIKSSLLIFSLVALILLIDIVLDKVYDIDVLSETIAAIVSVIFTFVITKILADN